MPEDKTKETTQEEVDEEKEEETKTLTQEEVNKLIAQSKSKAKDEARKELEAEYQEQLNDKVEEAKRLAKMNEEERKQHEFEQLKKELENLKTKEARYGLAREASKMLSEHSITADDETLQFVVKDTAEETQEAVKRFAELINQKVEQGVKEALSGKTPKVGSAKGMTKEKILAIKDNKTRIKAIQENPHFFK